MHSCVCYSVDMLYFSTERAGPGKGAWAAPQALGKELLAPATRPGREESSQTLHPHLLLRLLESPQFSQAAPALCLLNVLRAFLVPGLCIVCVLCLGTCSLFAGLTTAFFTSQPNPLFSGRLPCSLSGMCS